MSKFIKYENKEYITIGDKQYINPFLNYRNYECLYCLTHVWSDETKFEKYFLCNKCSNEYWDNRKKIVDNATFMIKNLCLTFGDFENIRNTAIIDLYKNSVKYKQNND